MCNGRRVSVPATFLMLCCLVGAADAQMWHEQSKLLPPDPGYWDLFGRPISISGNTAIIGSPWDDAPEERSGSAYIFQETGSGWEQVIKLVPDDGAAEDWFGHAVSISGNTAIVGSHRDDDNNETDSGSAYIFQDTGSGWVQVAKLHAADANHHDAFGAAVSISGNTAVIGADADDEFGPDKGAAYIFEDNGSGWTQVVKLLPVSGMADEFGISVAISGNTAIIGASLSDDNGYDSGSAYIFQDTGSGWEQKALLHPADGQAEDGFGDTVGISGDTVIVSSLGDDNENGADAGSAYVFEKPTEG